MRVIVLGGAGDMGSMAVRDLAQTPGVGEVTVADMNTQAAEALRQRLEGAPAKVTPRALNAMHYEELVQAIEGHDAVASALGPFYKFESLLLRAAIDARVPYASLCDDWSACERALDQLDAPAREAGVTAITGLGASPGMTNLLAVRLARDFSEVRRVDVNVYQPWNAGGGEAVLRHLCFIVSGEVAGFRKGKSLRMQACRESHRVHMPHYGHRNLYNLGHPEPVSLPRHFKDLESCNFFMGFGQGMGFFAWLARQGLFQNEGQVDAMLKILGPIERWMARKPPEPSAIRIDVKGTRKGKDLHLMACGMAPMREATGISLSVGTLMLARGEVIVREGGVYAPESCLDPDRFMEAMRDKGMQAYTDIEMTRVLE